MWTDQRLNLKDKNYTDLNETIIHYTMIDQIWYPDTFISNSVDCNGPTNDEPTSFSQKQTMRVNGFGEVFFSQRYFFILYYNMRYCTNQLRVTNKARCM